MFPLHLEVPASGDMAENEDSKPYLCKPSYDPWTPVETGKTMREKALKEIRIGSLYVALYNLKAAPARGKFHWNFYLHTNHWKGFFYDLQPMKREASHGPTCAILDRTSLCVAIKVANVPEDQLPRLDVTMRSMDDTNATTQLSGEKWVTNILQKLVDCGLVRCGNLERLR
jgi:hypothetical protein